MSNVSSRPGFALSRAIADFGGEVFAGLSAAENQIFSPLSIHAVLTVLAAAARGDTRCQLEQALGLDYGVEAAVDGYVAALDDMLQTGKPPAPGCRLSVDSSVWLAAGRPWQLDGLRPLLRGLRTEIAEADFAHPNRIGFSGPEGVRQAVNGWASDKTDGLIRELLAPGDVDAETKMILVNAVYFKAAWQTEFDPANTHTRPFALYDRQQVTATFMRREGEVLYAETEHAQAVCLPYAGGRMAMNVVLPRPGLEDLIDGRRLAASLTRRKVRLVIPRFTCRARYDLVPVLRAMGVEDAFDDRRANFALLADARDQLHVGKVVHEAVVEVTEEGTEAAAATAAAMKRCLSVDTARPKIFLADRPFTFTINHLPSNTVLFAGRCGRP